jgi:phosphocarrier protein
MERVTVTIKDPLGLHARPATLLVRRLQGYKCNISVYKNGNKDECYQPQSIISVMSMNAKKGDQLFFEADGIDEKEAIRAVAEFMEEANRNR